MNKITKAIVTAITGVIIAGTLAGCANDADVVSQNISTDADNFKVFRKIVAVNGITDTYIMTLEGWCNIVDQKTQLEVTCKVSDGYRKHFVGLSDNTFYFVEQLESSNVSPDHFKVVFHPSTVIPGIETR
jgi:hypothetical protein